MTSATAGNIDQSPHPEPRTGAANLHSRSPTITYHHKHLSPLQPNDLIASIAGGAHYAGALQHDEEVPPLHPRAWRRRSLSRSADDPNVVAAYQDVMADLKELYSGRPSPQTIERRWAKAATLEHPLFNCNNLHEVGAVLYTIPRLVKSADCLSIRILSAGLLPNRLVYAQTYVYTLRFFGIRKELKSIIFVDLDDDMKIAQLIDQWDGKELSTRWGAPAFRRTLVKLASWTASAPKDSS